MNEKIMDNFEKGIFWELYGDLERQFENFLDYVPYLEANENTYSFKLLNLILRLEDILTLPSKKWLVTRSSLTMKIAGKFSNC